MFFLDDAVALAAGHRPCALCRRPDYRAYRDAVTRGLQHPQALRAHELNARLNTERLHRGRGLVRAGDRILWPAPFAALPDGAVIVDADGICRLVRDHRLLRFAFDGWDTACPRPCSGTALVLTPPTSLLALTHGYRPALHASAE